ncbi:cyclin N-terminal domain-containing protein 1 [Sceloporus undulatus]|uniref:cyclin N-terminal domain-containing protein 1 n=1 Tax=Sceloporus undulatus TaxID=8520 RepID=UPI001C4AE112|nr:cyclin N-terminal domain-containing protein 1 [Sceloporus undulatus]
MAPMPRAVRALRTLRLLRATSTPGLEASPAGAPARAISHCLRTLPAGGPRGGPPPAPPSDTGADIFPSRDGSARTRDLLSEVRRCGSGGHFGRSRKWLLETLLPPSLMRANVQLPQGGKQHLKEPSLKTGVGRTAEMDSPAQVASRYRSSEPIFGVVAPGIIQDALLHMARENEQYLSELSSEAGSFKETKIVEFVFLLSEKWSLTETVRYQAIEIFERFMLTLTEEFSNCNRAKGEDNTWASVKQQIEDTYVLRLVSSIQLASKLSFHYRIVNNNMVLKFLKSLGFSYTTEELLESELAILKGLHFQINVPFPFAYVEMLLEVLGYNGYLRPTKELQEMCRYLLSLTYLLRSSIYDTLLKSSIENSSPSELQLAKFVSVKEDFMLLAVGVIGASSFLLNPEGWNQVVEHLSETTGISLQSIVEAVYAILKHSIEDC